MKQSKGHMGTALVVNSAPSHIDSLEAHELAAGKIMSPRFEWECRPSRGVSSGEALFPYLQNETLSKLPNSIATIPGEIWSLLFKS